MNDSRIVPVILSGGSGTRLWPLSRESFPKQLWPLVSDRTMIQETALRAHGPGFAPPVIVCNQEHRFLIAEQLREAGITGARIVLEPVGRNSAPAIAAAAVLVAEDNPDAILWMMAADASIADLPALHTALTSAAAAAVAGRIVTFGMRPTGPETGYGYIETGRPLDEAEGAFAVARFIEKPDAATAARTNAGPAAAPSPARRRNARRFNAVGGTDVLGPEDTRISSAAAYRARLTRSSGACAHCRRGVFFGSRRWRRTVSGNRVSPRRGTGAPCPARKNNPNHTSACPDAG